MALMEISAWSAHIPANATVNTIFELISRFFSQLLMHIPHASLWTVLSLSLNVLIAIIIYITWRKLVSKPENAEWQGKWEDLGKRLEAWGPPVSWDFTLEHLWDPQKLSEYLGKGSCGSGRSENERIVWGLACAYRAIYNTVLERDGFQIEIQTKWGNRQDRPNQSQEAPVSTLVAPVEGQKWKRVSSHLEQKEEEAEEEDPGEGPSPNPPSLRKATEESEIHGEESEEEGVIITTFRRALKMSEIQGYRKEFLRRSNETTVIWMLRCWDKAAGSLSLGGREARKLGNIARDPAIDRRISRCLKGDTTLWERILVAVKESHPYRDDLEPEAKEWDTVENGIEYLRQMATVEMLYDPMFLPNDPRQDRDPERVRCSPDILEKLSRTAPEKYASTLVATLSRYKGQHRRPPVFELIITLQTFEQQLPPSHVSMSAISKVAERVKEMEKTQEYILKKLQNRCRQLEERLTCPICIDDQIKLVFQCGHGSCSGCSKALTVCPICRQAIREKIQIFV